MSEYDAADDTRKSYDLAIEEMRKRIENPDVFLDGKVTLYHGDTLKILPALKANSVDAIVCDPPYHLTSIVKRFSKGEPAHTKTAKDIAGRKTPIARLAAGFMGKQWDGGDVAFDPETWKQAARVLKPGGHLIAFSGTRTYHRMACAIEDAGFEIRDQLAWIFGSGFPKSHNIGNGLGTALKPAHEPICLARKPLSESTIAANVLKWGTGAINVDGCRIEGEAWKHPGSNATDGIYGDFSNDAARTNDKGRWPANLVHDGSEEVLAGFPETTSGTFSGHRNEPKTKDIYGKFDLQDERGHVGDSGSAARFFYTAKADADDRLGSKHPTVKPVDLMQWLVRLVTPTGGTVLDPFAGTGTTGEAAWREGFRAILIEREDEYLADIARRMKLADAPRRERRAAAVKQEGHEDTPLFSGLKGQHD